jgi:hypothetical protein
MTKPPAVPTERIPELVQCLYEIVNELEALFPGRAFTPDGHLVGSIGEVIAAHRYKLTLRPSSNAAHDAIASNGTKVEIKATQGKRVALRAEPEHLIVLQLSKDGTSREVYNGPGPEVWAACSPMGKNGQRGISLTRLRELMAAVPHAARLQAQHNDG